MSDEAAGISPNDSFHTEESWLDEKTADVYFIIESEDNDKPIRIPAHKSKLASKSDVFDAMFFGDMAEKGDVRMVDVSVDLFKMFLRFFYKCDVKLTMENVNDVTNMCNKYNVIHGLEKCETFLRSIMSYDNIIDVYELAIVFERSKLKHVCEATIRGDPQTFFSSNSFLKCQKHMLSQILDLNALFCTEGELFEACISWTKAASGLEELTNEAFAEHFGDLLYKIRFPAMFPIDFASISCRYGYLIPPDDYREIVQAILSGGSFEATNFIKDSRQGRWNRGAIIECCRDVIMEERFIASDDALHLRTTFSSNEPLLLGEFVIQLEDVPKIMRHLPNYNSGFTVVVEEVTGPGNVSGRVLEQVSKVISKTFGCLFKIELPKPVLIRPGIYYKICVKQITSMILQFFKYIQTSKKVNLDDEVTITFHDERLPFFDEIYGFTPILRFNRV